MGQSDDNRHSRSPCLGILPPICSLRSRPGEAGDRGDAARLVGVFPKRGQHLHKSKILINLMLTYFEVCLLMSLGRYENAMGDYFLAKGKERPIAFMQNILL